MERSLVAKGVLRKTATKRYAIETLYRDEEALVEECGISWFAGDVGEAMAQLWHERQSFWVDGAKCLERQRPSGTNLYEFASCWYFSSLRSAAPSAAPPWTVDLTGRYNSASVSVTVTSQVRQCNQLNLHVQCIASVLRHSLQYCLFLRRCWC